MLHRDLRRVSDQRRSPRPSNRGETTVTQTRSLDIKLVLLLPTTAFKKINREERESGRRRSTRHKKLSRHSESGRKVTNSDCHSAHSYG